MVKVKCRVCGDIGYTVSPDHTRCECGGRLRELAEGFQDKKDKFSYSLYPIEKRCSTSKN